MSLTLNSDGSIIESMLPEHFRAFHMMVLLFSPVVASLITNQLLLLFSFLRHYFTQQVPRSEMVEQERNCVPNKQGLMKLGITTIKTFLCL